MRRVAIKRPFSNWQQSNMNRRHAYLQSSHPEGASDHLLLRRLRLLWNSPRLSCQLSFLTDQAEGSDSPLPLKCRLRWTSLSKIFLRLNLTELLRSPLGVLTRSFRSRSLRRSQLVNFLTALPAQGRLDSRSHQLLCKRLTFLSPLRLQLSRLPHQGLWPWLNQR